MPMTSAPIRRRVFELLELGSLAGRQAAIFEAFMVLLIVSNVVVVAMETVPSLWAQYETSFVIFEAISVAFFTVEYFARLWVSVERQNGETIGYKQRLKYMLSPLALIDLFAILPFYLTPFVAADLRVLRVFRLLRLFKLVRYSPALSTVGRVIFAERRALAAALVVMAGLEITAATLMYIVEHNVQPEAFGSIPQALWWAVATLTTVGYGDVVPITALGKFIGGAVMIFGLAFYALPIGIIASGFSDELHRREFLVPIGMVEAFPPFQGLQTEAQKELVSRIRSLVVSPGTILAQRKETSNGLYFIISGEISIFHSHKILPLKAPDFFGEIGMIYDCESEPAAVAAKPTKLMWLESQDLQLMLSFYPTFADSLRIYGEQRLSDFVENGFLDKEGKTEMLEQMSGRLTT